MGESSPTPYLMLCAVLSCSMFDVYYLQKSKQMAQTGSLYETL